MIDFARADTFVMRSVDHVVTPILATGVDPQDVLLVGAACRDILHTALGFSLELRSTDDTDFGVAVSRWLDFTDRESLSAENRSALARRWRDSDDALLARHFGLQNSIAWPSDILRRREYLDRLRVGVLYNADYATG